MIQINLYSFRWRKHTLILHYLLAHNTNLQAKAFYIKIVGKYLYLYYHSSFFKCYNSQSIVSFWLWIISSNFTHFILVCQFFSFFHPPLVASLSETYLLVHHSLRNWNKLSCKDTLFLLFRICCCKNRIRCQWARKFKVCKELKGWHKKKNRNVDLFKM